MFCLSVSCSCFLVLSFTLLLGSDVSVFLAFSLASPSFLFVTLGQEPLSQMWPSPESLLCYLPSLVGAGFEVDIGPLETSAAFLSSRIVRSTRCCTAWQTSDILSQPLSVSTLAWERKGTMGPSAVCGSEPGRSLTCGAARQAWTFSSHHFPSCHTPSLLNSHLMAQSPNSPFYPFSHLQHGDRDSG